MTSSTPATPEPSGAHPPVRYKPSMNSDKKQLPPVGSMVYIPDYSSPPYVGGFPCKVVAHLDGAIEVFEPGAWPNGQAHTLKLGEWLDSLEQL